MGPHFNFGTMGSTSSTELEWSSPLCLGGLGGNAQMHLEKYTINIVVQNNLVDLKEGLHKDTKPGNLKYHLHT